MRRTDDGAGSRPGSIHDARGVWRVRRAIFDGAAGEIIRFHGTAVISDETFTETGATFSDRDSFPAQRLYLLDWATGGLSVRRRDGGHFVTLRDAPDQRVTHLCGADNYCGRFIFARRDRWSEIWSVVGPRKRYRSISLYARAGEG